MKAQKGEFPTENIRVDFFSAALCIKPQGYQIQDKPSKIIFNQHYQISSRPGGKLAAAGLVGRAQLVCFPI